jgi:hypothetical protein
MALTEEQNKKVAVWIREGLNLSQIQKNIESELEISMTYMDVRFLVDDLDLDLQCDPEDPEESDQEDKLEEVSTAGSVVLEVDVITKPGTVVSGNVTFSDGQTCDWQLDQMGRLGLVPAQEGYQPDEEDVKEFQTKLQEELKKKGFG